MPFLRAHYWNYTIYCAQDITLIMNAPLVGFGGLKGPLAHIAYTLGLNVVPI